MDRQAEIPDEPDQFQVIAQGQFGVEAPLEQDPAAAVVLEFREFGRQRVPSEDVAVRRPREAGKRRRSGSPRCRCWCS